MRKIIAILFMLAGVALIGYPSGKQLYSDYMQKKIIREWERGQEVNQDAFDSFGQLGDIFVKAEPLDETPEMVISSQSYSSGITTKSDKASRPAPQDGQMLGTIEIKRINIRLPILEGATQKSMKTGAGHLAGTPYPGQPGNSAIAAHRSRAFGKMFNRLGEVKVGDIIVVKDRNNTYKYKVYERLIVTPDDTAVLKGNGQDSLLTLITCDPVDTATHRLIIHAKMVP
ncbi:class D sortase [Bacillus sp. B-jedd]|uniref:class D sortase n=1 Tax=Bacillus sp. B-jedd TaxID=1476857 RepID=UPI0005156626|nr:class D sortase [Bacillus sp. B-jedd]CEG29178.1 sortase [Bacillus sp. B-jedd]